MAAPSGLTEDAAEAARENRRLRLFAYAGFLLTLLIALKPWEPVSLWLERREVRSLSIEELIDRDDWIAGERIAELGEEATPAILRRLRAGDEKAACALIWNAEAGFLVFLDLWRDVPVAEARRIANAFAWSWIHLGGGEMGRPLVT